nr:proline-rich receptor-like protein kinase PERK9 [Aegilops tauschii subsp. strangulata]
MASRHLSITAARIQPHAATCRRIPPPPRRPVSPSEARRARSSPPAPRGSPGPAAPPSASSAAVRLRLRRPRRRPPEGCATLIPPTGDQCRAPASLAPPRASPFVATPPCSGDLASPPRAGSGEIRPEDRHRAQIRTGPTSSASSPTTPSPDDVFFQLRRALRPSSIRVPGQTLDLAG